MWGLFYAVILLAEKLFLNKWTEKLPIILRWFLTFAVVNVAWILFRVENGVDLVAIFNNIFTFSGLGLREFLPANFSIVYYFVFMIIGFIFMFPWKNLIKKEHPRLALLGDIILILLFILGILSLINNSYNPFIYFRF